MLCINLDIHKYVHARDLGDIDRNQTAVPVVHQEVGAKRCRTEVIYAARSVRHISKDKAMLNSCKTGTRHLCL